eukprot:GDKI01011303.1.p1 GENE.GDKI01011303.1~~GDKI01011303.1.p1  ORF type:complete len:238 (-),score=75.52 GDKI01011303.1:229-942(-)
MAEASSSSISPAQQTSPSVSAANRKPKLVYFQARGRAEIIRLIFAQAKVEYDDVRFREPPHAMEDFDRLKRTVELPFDQVPILEIDGVLLAQSQAIVRYVARKYGLMGQNEVENGLADMIMCGTEDFRQKFTQVMFAKTEQERDHQLLMFKNEVLPKWACYFQKILRRNATTPGGSQWFVGSRLTYADLAVYDLMSTISVRLPGAFDAFEALKNHYANVEALPNIKKWLETRPDNQL